MSGANQYVTVASRGTNTLPSLELSGNSNTGSGTIGRIDFYNQIGATDNARISTQIGNDTSFGNLIFSTGNSGTLTEAARFDQNGNFGVGTTSPGSILAVAGSANFVNGATSTIYNGLNVIGSCYALNGVCLSNVSLTANNNWTGLQTFANSSSTLTTLGTTWFSGITNGVLSTNANGQVVATTSIGTNYLTGNLGTVNGTPFNVGSSITVGSASTTLLTDNNTFAGNEIFNNLITGSVSGNAGTATALQNARTINGVSFNGTANITINAASSTLLANNNTFSGTNAFANTTFSNATSSNFAISNLANTLLAVNANGTVVATSTIGNNQLQNSTISGVSLGGTLANLSAGTGLSGSAYNGSGVQTFSLNLANANNWTALQTFTNATSTLFSAGTIWDTGVTNGVLSTNANGQVVATTSIGTNYLIGNLATINGTTVAENGSYTIAAASSTLLSNNNTFSGTNSFTGNTTFANATSTNFFSTVASSTNLFAQTASIGSLNLGNALSVANGGTGINSTPSYGNILVGNGTNYTLTASSSLGLPTFANLASVYPFPLTGNATSTLTQFNGGLTAFASSTIGNGNQNGGLTVNGGATTTGNALFSGNVTIRNSAIPASGTINFGNVSANLAYNGSDYVATGGSLYTAAGRIVAQANSETLGLGARYNAGTGTFFIGATNSATPDLVFTNNAFVERARLTDSGNFGLGTTSPYAQLSVATPNGASGSLTTLFAISSSTPTATTTLFSISNAGAITQSQIFNSLVAANSNGQLVATSSIGTNLLTGTLAIANGGSNAISYTQGQLLSFNGTSFVSTSTIGNNQLANSSVTINSTNVALGGSATITAASSTLLANNNTFSGANTFSQTITGSVSGNAGTATALQNARTINGVSFNGTANITVNAASSTLLTDSNNWTGLQTFANSSSTLATLGTTWFSGITNGVLSTNAQGQVVATTSIGTNYLTGVLGTVNGTALSEGGSITVSAASSTLLSNNNTFSGLQTFNGGYIDNASSTHTAFTQFTNASTTQLQRT